MNKETQRVVEYEDGTFGIEILYGYKWIDSSIGMRYATETKARAKIASTAVKRVCK